MDHLPNNRFELFKELLHYRFLDLIICSLCLGLFILPDIVFNIFIQDTFINDNYFFNYILIYSIKIIFFMIFGLGVSGALYFFKRLTFGEGASVRNDFFYGIRRNYKTFLLIYFLLGLFYGLIHINSSVMFETFEKGSVIPPIFVGLSYVLYALFIIISMFMQTQAILYNASFKQLFINGVRFLIGKFFKNILIFTLTMFPFILMEFFSNEVLDYICILFYIFGYFSISLLIINLYSNSVFDLTINKNYPELIKRGIKK